jgi:hypothetical protein
LRQPCIGFLFAALVLNASKVTFVAENAPIPVQAFSSLLASMSPHKLAAILVLTAEMLSGMRKCS